MHSFPESCFGQSGHFQGQEFISDHDIDKRWALIFLEQRSVQPIFSI